MPDQTNCSEINSFRMRELFNDNSEKIFFLHKKTVEKKCGDLETFF